MTVVFQMIVSLLRATATPPTSGLVPEELGIVCAAKQSLGPTVAGVEEDMVRGEETSLTGQKTSLGKI
jgi:hypothetical protein